MSKKQDYRLRIFHPPSTSDLASHFTYIVRKGDRVLYMGASETPLALSNLIFDIAAEARFRLEDALHGDEAAKELRAVLKQQWARNLKSMPTVEVL